MVTNDAGGNGRGVSDDGLWPPGKHEAPMKLEENLQGVPDAIRGEVPRKPAEVATEGASGDDGFFPFAFVVLALLFAGVFVVWKKNKKDRRRES